MTEQRMTGRRGIACFALEPDAAQLNWSTLPRGEVTVDSGIEVTRFESDGGPAAVDVVLDGPSEIDVRVDGRRVWRGVVRPTEPPPGEELYRFATLSDLHLGALRFGRLEEVDVEVPHPVRCTRAAITEALAWGARRLVVKGDVVHTSRPHTWAMAADLLGDLPVPVDLVCGNHEVNGASTVDPFAEAARHGLSLHPGVTSVDLPGVRAVLFDSALPLLDVGRWDHLREPVCDALADADGPALLFSHHQPQEWVVPTYMPLGSPARAARRFLRAARAANPTLLGASGHTHRHRRRRIEGVEWAETGSPKDYPGTWTGYVVHEGGVRQVVRRVARPDCIRWTERTRQIAFGAWGRWSPGSLADRCFVHPWSDDQRDATSDTTSRTCAA
jgi:3',5'-cyclic-AMP phosphodiesterase